MKAMSGIGKHHVGITLHSSECGAFSGAERRQLYTFLWALSKVADSSLAACTGLPRQGECEISDPPAPLAVAQVSVDEDQHGLAQRRCLQAPLPSRAQCLLDVI